MAADDTLAEENSDTLTHGYLPPKTGELFLSLPTPTSSVADSHTPVLPDQTFSGANDGPHSRTAVVEVGSHSHASHAQTPGHVFVTMPTSPTPQSMNVSGVDQLPALIPTQQTGTETDTGTGDQSLKSAPPTKRGRGRGHSRGRGQLRRSEQLVSGGEWFF